MRIIFKYLLTPVMLLAFASIMTGCADDKDEINASATGAVQFRLYKDVKESELSTKTLDYLSAAKKIKVVLLDDNGGTITQTRTLSAYNDELAEYGLTSDKFDLLEGTYRITAYYLYNKAEVEIHSALYEQSETIEVISGGLTQQEIYVDAQSYGKVRLTCVKEFVDVTLKSAEASNRNSVASFPFSSFREIDLTLRNVRTNEEIVYDDLRVTYTQAFDGDTVGSNITATSIVDSLLLLKPDTYVVTRYSLTTIGGNSTFTTNTSPIQKPFTVIGNRLNEADVPITISELAPNIQDYIALKKIWEALDGPNWSYVGEEYPNGLNWNFDMDLDMWGQQPGISMTSTGRVQGITIGGFGPKGEVPAEIGLLTELTYLTLGELNDDIGNYPLEVSARAKENLVKARGTTNSQWGSESNQAYVENYIKTNVMATFSPEMQECIAELENEPYERADFYDPIMTPRIGIFTNQITAIDPAIGNLTKLLRFEIANSPIAEIPQELWGIETLTDVQVANCPNITTFPAGMENLQRLVSLNMAFNPQIPGAEFTSGLDRLCQSEASKDNATIQLVYLAYNEIEELPTSVNLLHKLGAIDCSYNKITHIPDFGEDVTPVNLLFTNNKITSVGNGGTFCRLDDLETVTLSYNELTEFPDVFSSLSPYQISTLDLSYNKIGNVQPNNGIYVQILSMVGNDLTEFPSELYDAYSSITYLNLARNNISSFPVNSFVNDQSGDSIRIDNTTTLDLSYNRLDALPRDFNSSNLPRLSGLDLSGNKFSGFPGQLSDLLSLGILSMNYMVDDDGYRCFDTWQPLLYTHIGFRRIFVRGNAFRNLNTDYPVSPTLDILDITDNPEIVVDLSKLCSNIVNGTLIVVYDPTQDLRGCPNLILE
ncbi:MAG: DUF4458 domain-containing protein [Mangrovibacterium sp.]